MLERKDTKYTIREVLSTSKRADLYRGIRTADGQPVVLKVLTPQHRPQHFTWLKNEYEIGMTLNIPTAVKPIALETYEGRPTLVMEDFGGESLNRTLGAPMEVGQFLRLASGSRRPWGTSISGMSSTKTSSRRTSWSTPRRAR